MTRLKYCIISVVTLIGCNVGEDVSSSSSEQANTQMSQTGVGLIPEKTSINFEGSFRGKLAFFPRGAVAVVIRGSSEGSEKVKLNGRTYEVAAHGGKNGVPFFFVNESNETVTHIIEVIGKDAQFEIWKYRWADQHTDGTWDAIFPAGLPCSRLEDKQEMLEDKQEIYGTTGSYDQVWLSLQSGQPVKQYADRCIPGK